MKVYSLIRKFFFSAVLWVPISQLWADTSVRPFVFVSDIDDTVKITHVGSYTHAVWNGFWGTSVFPGMKELYQELRPQADSMVYLSAAPQSMSDRVKDLLVRQKGFPDGSFLLSNWWNWEKSYAFKFKELVRLSTLSESPFLLIGDDTENDPEVFSEFQKSVPSRTLQAYVHQIGGRPLPEGVLPFLTAFDLALYEFVAGRLSAQQVIKVGVALLDPKQSAQVFPYYKLCPKNFSFTNLPVSQTPEVQQDQAIQEVLKSVEGFIRTICDTSRVM